MGDSVSDLDVFALLVDKDRLEGPLLRAASEGVVRADRVLASSSTVRETRVRLLRHLLRACKLEGRLLRLERLDVSRGWSRQSRPAKAGKSSDAAAELANRGRRHDAKAADSAAQSTRGPHVSTAS
jgi:hypothetical protein